MKKILAIINLIIIVAINSTAHTVSTPPALMHIGNTCYLNSTLQCLYQIEPLTNFLVTRGRDFYESESVALEYIDFLGKVSETKVDEAALKKLCEPIFEKLFDKRKYNQEDASEFLGKLLDRLVDEDVKGEKKTNEFINGTAFRISPITNYFLPLIFSITKTTSRPIDNDPDCQIAPKTTPELMLNLAIPKSGTKIMEKAADSIINENKYETLESCLKSYSSEETLARNEQYKCPNGKLVDIIKETKIQTCPAYLIIALKRFLKTDTEQLVKDIRPVSFPLENLDLKPYMTPDAKQTETKYDLISFVQHSGSRSGGHYTSYVKSNGNWYFCNDSVILGPIPEKSEIPGKLDMQKITSKGTDGGFTPYIMFYKRKDVSNEEITKQPAAQVLSNLESQLQALAAKDTTAK